MARQDHSGHFWFSNPVEALRNVQLYVSGQPTHRIPSLDSQRWGSAKDEALYVNAIIRKAAAMADDTVDTTRVTDGINGAHSVDALSIERLLLSTR